MLRIVGIDEAGYSPLLGPLVVSSAAFDAPVVPDNWWLSMGIPRVGDPRKAPLPAVDDSKKLYSTATGPGGLERGVLGFLAAVGKRPRTLDELLRCVGAAVDVSGYPWYGAAGGLVLPVAADPDSIERAAEALNDVFEESGIRFAGFHSSPLLAGEYNRRLARCSNKSFVLCRASLELAARHLQGPLPVCVLADKQGGRHFYAGLLRQYFFGADVREGEEGRELSCYEVSSGGRGRDLGFHEVESGCSRWQISFCLGGDARHLPIALASMCSKYIRELFLHLFNTYWHGIRPDLPRTSGYRPDCHRFLAAAEALAEFCEADRDKLVRLK